MQEMLRPTRLADPASVFDLVGQALVHDNLIDERGLERAIRAAGQSGERLDHVLVKLGLVPEPALIAVIARVLSIPVVSGEDLPRQPVLPERIAARFVKARKVLPLADDSAGLTVAQVDPLDLTPLEALSYLMQKPVQPRIIAQADFERAVGTLYTSQELPDEDRHRHAASETDVQRLRDMANEAPVIRLVNQLVSTAVESRASDIHIEPGVSDVAVRYRIDGELRNSAMLPIGLRAAVTSRIKIMAKLDIAERRMPQDGRIKLPVHGIDVDFRVSTIPTIYGESVVMRVLDRSRVELSFPALGFAPGDVESFLKLVNKPNGIVLVTGPTGSGKTTTLYTALKELNKPNLKIFTVEDPIEYQFAGINQVQVQSSIGLSFPHALRSILRQDPDVIMIGEIRDVETARIAIQASLTGHLVLSTVHTNSAPATITRLIDMGTENYLLASTVNGILAQRLTRRLCPHCARPHASESGWRSEIERQLTSGGRNLLPEEEPRILAPGGCEACGHTGFRGRLAITELMVIDDRLRDLILAHAPDARLEEAARQSGMRTLYEDGLIKIWKGLTTPDEVLRITRTDE